MDTKKLRQKILDLAIRGKLVPQDPNDEPAYVLLQKIREEKLQLVKAGKLKKKDLIETPIAEDEIPFEIPESWEWVRLITLSKYIHYGYTASAAPKGNSKLLRITDIQDDKVHWATVPFCTIKDNDLEKYQLHNSDILIARTGGTIGKTYIVRELNEVAVFASYLIRAIPLESVYEEYLKLFMSSPCYWTQLTDAASGTGQPNVNGQSLSNLIVPLPPLAEQKRIANEVERWFTLIEELESNEGDLLKAIDKAKSKILDLAIHGKLVPQDPNDEPAIELLKRINPKFEPCDMEECPFAIPHSWEWTNMGMCSKYESASIDPSKYKDQEFELYSVPSFETGMPDFVHGANISSSKKLVEEEDVLLCKINPHLNRTWIVEHHKKALQCIASSEWIIFRNKDINSQYLLRCFTSSYFLNLMLSNVSGVGGSLMRAQPSCVEKYLFPLPPYAEQLRIVTKIEELFAVLDDIKESLE